MNNLYILLLQFFPYFIHGQVNPGGGSFTCQPCGRSNCYLSDKDKKINVPKLGSLTCGEIQEGADLRLFFPDECGSIQIITLATSDPCTCKLYNGDPCPDPGFTNTQECNLCGGDKRIGDPHMIIKSGILSGVECIAAFDDNEFGAFASVCPAAKASIQKWCSCIDKGEIIKQCIPQEDKAFPCDPNDPSDVCCEGECRFRSSHQTNVCTNKPAQPSPPNFSPPSRSPIRYAPNMAPEGPLKPSRSPMASSIEKFFKTPPGVDECSPLEGCPNKSQRCRFIGSIIASYKCINANLLTEKSSLSVGNGGGAGAKAKKGNNV